MKKPRMFFARLVALLMLCSTGLFSACDLFDSSSLSGISITTQPKLEYLAGQHLDLSGMVITAQMSNGYEYTISESDYTVVPANGTELTEAGTIKVRVIYRYFEAEMTVTVTVQAVASLTIVKYPTKRIYEGTDAVDLTGMELSAIWNDGTVTAVSLSDCEATRTGDLITVTAHGLSVTFSIQSGSIELVAKDFNDTPAYNCYEDGIVDGLPKNALLDFWNPNHWTNHPYDNLSWEYDTFGQKPIFEDGILKFTSQTAMQRFDAFRVDNSAAYALGAPNLYDNIGAEVYKAHDDVVYSYTVDLKATGTYQLMLFSAQTTLPNAVSGTSMGVFFRRTAAGFEISSVNMGGVAVGTVSDTSFVINGDDFNRLDFTAVRKDSHITLTFYINGIRINWDATSNVGVHARIEDGNFVFRCGQKENGPDSFPRMQTEYPNYGHRICVVPDSGTEVWLRKTVAV